jgi:hypothetical protein
VTLDDIRHRILADAEHARDLAITSVRFLLHAIPSITVEALNHVMVER